MKRKVKEKSLVNKSMLEKRASTFDEEIECFGRPTHNKHTGKKYSHVHAEMDKISKTLSRHHRIYGHSVKFLKKYFRSEDEILSGYNHLLVDFVDHILGDVVKIVLENIKKKKGLPPQFFIVKNGKALWDIKENQVKDMLKKHGKGEWDITQKAIKKMVENISNVYINILTDKKNRAVGKK